MYISFNLCLIFTWSTLIAFICVCWCQCYFREGPCHHLSDQGYACTWAPLCFSEPSYYLLQLSPQLKVSGQAVDRHNSSSSMGCPGQMGGAGGSPYSTSVIHHVHWGACPLTEQAMHIFVLFSFPPRNGCLPRVPSYYKEIMEHGEVLVRPFSREEQLHPSHSRCHCIALGLAETSSNTAPFDFFIFSLSFSFWNSCLYIRPVFH